ncbi:hypothetical protein G6Z94_11660 [Vibrio aestuarianus]|uniref:hypothetical protein n=1 Tax=Vibrio aestuarianus TaxID=28171 RepID=UPI001592D773|nr:hypothetical protein [Vibrio aestuarianus]NGZ17995.1 hypothetical protein [Vibrio aestuarianus]
MDRRYQQLRDAALELAEHPRSSSARETLLHMLNHKLCKTCWKELPLTDFGKQESTFDGYRNHCKVCRSEARR